MIGFEDIVMKDYIMHRMRIGPVLLGKITMKIEKKRGNMTVKKFLSTNISLNRDGSRCVIL
jgi:hypothetical protein